MPQPLISIVTTCFDQEGEIASFYEGVNRILGRLGDVRHEHLFCDDASTDGSLSVLREIAARDRNVKVVVNARTFGPERSLFATMMRARGDAVVVLGCETAGLPELLPEMLRLWRAGEPVIVPAASPESEASVPRLVHRAVSSVLARSAGVILDDGPPSFALLDRAVVERLRDVPDPLPSLRGLLAELGIGGRSIAIRPAPAPPRGRRPGLIFLYDRTMASLTSHSKAPIRLAALTGFALAAVSLLIATGYLAMKLAFWDRFGFGLAPLLIGIFFFAAVQLFFIGLIGEYVASIHDIALRRPRVVERERINFDER